MAPLSDAGKSMSRIRLGAFPVPCHKSVFRYNKTLTNRSKVGMEMADFLSKRGRSARMAAVKSQGTRPELMLRESLQRRGLNPETNSNEVVGRPDILFPKDRLACFVDGDLWHGGQWRRRGRSCLNDQFAGATKKEYWLRKINSNLSRDIRITANLIEAGWSVIRFWESDVEKDVERCADRIGQILVGSEKPDPLSYSSTASVADFFAGIGLMRLGIERAGWRVVWANDFDESKRRLYQHNLGSREVHFDPRPIEKIGVNCIPQVGLISACFPCTDLSLAGAVRGLEDGPQSSSFLRFAKILGRMRTRRPPFVILENVVGLIHSHGGKDFRTCLQSLSDAGYHIDAIKSTPFISSRKAALGSSLSVCAMISKSPRSSRQMNLMRRLSSAQESLSTRFETIATCRGQFGLCHRLCNESPGSSVPERPWIQELEHGVCPSRQTAQCRTCIDQELT